MMWWPKSWADVVWFAVVFALVYTLLTHMFIVATHIWWQVIAAYLWFIAASYLPATWVITWRKTRR